MKIDIEAIRTRYIQGTMTIEDMDSLAREIERLQGIVELMRVGFEYLGDAMSAAKTDE